MGLSWYDGSMEWFSNVVGQEQAKRVLIGGLASGNLPQTLVFVGPRGVGRRLTAGLLAEYLHESANPTHADTFYFETVLEDKRARNVAVPMKETTNDMIRFLQMSPMVSKVKVAIVGEAGTMSEESQSALLKTLEEPRSDRLIVLVVERLEDLLPTILSRSQVVRFSLLPDVLVAESIHEPVDSKLTQMANGSIGRAMDLKNDSDMVLRMERLRDRWMKLKGQDIESRLVWSEELRERDRAIEFLEEGLRWIHRDVMGEMAWRVEEIEQVEKTLMKVRDNANVRLALDAMMLSV